MILQVGSPWKQLLPGIRGLSGPRPGETRPRGPGPLTGGQRWPPLATAGDATTGGARRWTAKDVLSIYLICLWNSQHYSYIMGQYRIRVDVKHFSKTVRKKQTAWVCEAKTGRYQAACIGPRLFAGGAQWSTTPLSCEIMGLLGLFWRIWSLISFEVMYYIWFIFTYDILR